MHPFGSLAMAKDHAARKSSLVSASRKCVVLGPAAGTKDSFKIVYLDTNAVAHSRDLRHFDTEFPFNKDDARSPSLLEPPEMVSSPSPPPPGSRIVDPALANNPFAVLSDLDGGSVAGDRPRRVPAAPAPVYQPGAFEAQRRHDREQLANVAVQPEGDMEPVSLRAALATDAATEWLSATRSELSAHRKNGTWSVVSSLPRGRSAIPSRFVFKVKRGPDGGILKYKCRLVAKGFRQRPLLDYQATFSPTLRTSTFRMLCALACQLSLSFHQMDVSTAFLVPPLKEEIYLRLPEQDLVDQHLPEYQSSPLVRLNKTLYGLVQSPREFYLHLSKILVGMGLTQSAQDPCLWLCVRKGRLVCAIAFYVDDICVVCVEEEIQDFKSALQRNFEMTDGGEISWFLVCRSAAMWPPAPLPLTNLQPSRVCLSSTPCLSVRLSPHPWTLACRWIPPLWGRRSAFSCSASPIAPLWVPSCTCSSPDLTWPTRSTSSPVTSLTLAAATGRLPYES